MVVTLDEKWIGKVAIVTGASSGIGEAIAERLVEEGMQVVGLARRKERLDQIAKRVTGKKGKFYPIKTDMSKEDDILSSFKWVKDNLGTVHVMVNNAGISKLSLFTESDTKSWTDVLQVNVIGLSIATRESIKSMREGNFDGHVVSINSILGHHVANFPLSNMYSPSKHAVTAIHEVLRQELASMGSKIKITDISPGIVDTDLITESSKKIGALNFLKTQIDFLQPKDIAEAVVYVLSTPSSVLVNELIIRPVGEVV
ncbi:unnamed protein product [Psylliodes chrysocephalus]|uniref:Farnesol dehydrogenase-like n=1 Tax=Psylliodes chrysocephalus TaxID=3402493 RepID=A0A9P0D162_9CUCU|nr:unnamed protein product [Psylliodes chrysocephala]